MEDLRDLREAADYVRRTAKQLDPGSRYVSELLEIIANCSDVHELERVLASNNRGHRWAGAAFERMSLGEKLYANLVTPETRVFRFEPSEVAGIEACLGELSPTTARILVVPCSRGVEAYTWAAYCCAAGVSFELLAMDLQLALVEHAPESVNELPHDQRIAVQRALDEGSRVTFEHGDLFELERDRAYDVVSCRNLLGFFIDERASAALRRVRAAVAPGGYLMLDSFCVTQLPGIAELAIQLGGERVAELPIFRF